MRYPAARHRANVAGLVDLLTDAKTFWNVPAGLAITDSLPPVMLVVRRDVGSIETAMDALAHCTRMGRTRHDGGHAA